MVVTQPAIMHITNTPISAVFMNKIITHSSRRPPTTLYILIATRGSSIKRD
jgi:hypothetical protein